MTRVIQPAFENTVHHPRRRQHPARVVAAAIIGALLAMAPLSQAAQPAARKPATQPARPTAQTGVISRDPYLGAILVDASTGRVLLADQADAKGYPASVLKLMDLLIALETIQRGQISLQDQVTVSAKAARMGGSQVWLAEKEVFSVDDLLYALMVQSANDAAVALAEKIAGSTDAFVGLMNQRARQLGMASTVFNSVHGLPPGTGQSPDITTARDLSLLCRELLKHPDTLRYTSTRERPFRAQQPDKTVIMRTHNHVMTQTAGCDGLKTGYYTRAGYSIAVTAARNGQRVIAIVLGSTDRKVRDAKATELLEKGLAALSSTPGNAPVRSR